MFIINVLTVTERKKKRRYYFCTAPCTFIGYIQVTDTVEKDL